MESRPTIYDVAKAAGVAASTVSRAFSRPGRVGAETAQRIFAAAESLGYRASGLPGLVGSRTGTIALVVTDITNPFYVEIIRGAHEAAADAGYLILLSHTQEDAQLERTWTERGLPAVDGVVLASSRMSDSTIRMVAKQKPTIVLNRRLPEVPSVITDNARGVRRAVEHLVGLGHDTITYLAGPETSWADGMRWQALREAGAELGVRVRRIGPGNTPTVAAGHQLAGEVLAHRPTAVLAYNDAMAIGVQKGLKRLGVRIPQDTSVVGFDNIILADLVEPALTTVGAPLHTQGAIGVKNLIAMVGGATPRREPVVLPVQLVVRDSTGRRRR
ncbi:LacI family transcriptional regulator [Pseudonocardia sulfidoxydans NBRC 16205]|uniref:LacI family transcriptional regulator n=1 Tax=Pseudonocardia sulfidoxydans NBRC 16205 TaxID=1223511 RepID=A0A511DK64_9PSEU|nr:LacI family DNA-binding transcriptional regulator [Pseudonocardia sulfidoxydans]GEL25210.1 LacI family transcriptional regulator [Pseudonocardia sulfidoxydans NBRC 16205]